MNSFKFLSGLLVASLTLNLINASPSSTAAVSDDMSMGMEEMQNNGLSALEIKIEAEQIADENNEMLQRIINLADDIMRETDDMVGELAPAGQQVTIDAAQANDYCTNHSSQIKEIAYKLWKDGKNLTVSIEDIAEMLLDYASEMEMASEMSAPEAMNASVARKRRSATDAPPPFAAEGTTAAAGASPPVVPGDSASTTVGALSTPVIPIATTAVPAITIEPVDVEGAADRILKMADHAKSEFDRELENIVTLAQEMKVVMAFQANNIFDNMEAVEETQEDIRDAEEEVMAYCDRIIDTSINIREQNAKSMGMITEMAQSIYEAE